MGIKIDLDGIVVELDTEVRRVKGTPLHLVPLKITDESGESTEGYIRFSPYHHIPGGNFIDPLKQGEFDEKWLKYSVIVAERYAAALQNKEIIIKEI